MPAQTAPTLRRPAEVPAQFDIQLAGGQTVRVEQIGAETPVPATGDPVLRELRYLIGSLLALGPLAAQAHGIGRPTAWVAATPAPDRGEDLGLAWWTPLPWHQLTAIAEVRLADGVPSAELGRVLLDLLVLSATEGGVEWLQVRLPGNVPELAQAVTTLRGRALSPEDGADRFEIPLGAEPRRYHRSGIHRRVTRATTPTTLAIAPGE